MKRTLLLVTIVLTIAALAMPQSGVAAAQKAVAQKGKPTKDKDPEPVLTFHLELADRPNDTLLSDGRLRLNPEFNDADMDDFGDLIGPYEGMGGPIFYVDHRITLDVLPSGPYADPCNKSFTEDGGMTRAQLNVRNCSFETPIYQDDDRTFTIVLDKRDPLGGGACACDAFRYLVEMDENGNLIPAPMYNGELARSTFVENADGTCEVTPAAGPIVTDSDHNLTGSQQITAYPYEVAAKGKGKKSGESVSRKTTVHISFRTDRADVGQLNWWRFSSQGETVPIDAIDENDPDKRVVTADNHLFDLILASAGPSAPPQCTNIQMSFQLTYKRFEVPQ